MKGPEIDAGVKVNNIILNSMRSTNADIKENEQYKIMKGPKIGVGLKLNNIICHTTNLTV